MLNIPETVKALFKLDACRKNFRVHFPNGEMNDLTNADVVEESVEFSESICSQSTFKFGLSESSTIEFETVGVGNMLGMTIDCGIEIDLSSLTAAQLADIAAGTWDGEYVPVTESDLGYAFFHVPYGRFIVKQCPRDHQAMTHRRVEAYTDTKNLVTPYMQTLMDTGSYPETYTPNFAYMFYSVMGQNNEQLLIDAGFTKTDKGTLDNMLTTETMQIPASTHMYTGYGKVNITTRYSVFNISIGGANDADRIYGIGSFDKANNSDVMASISRQLVDDYGVPEADAYNYKDFGTTVDNLAVTPKEITCEGQFSSSYQYGRKHSLDCTNYIGLSLINPDRETVKTTIKVLYDVSVDLYTTGGSLAGTIQSSIASGFDDTHIYQYDPPADMGIMGFEMDLKPSGKETWAYMGGDVNVFSESIDASKAISDFLELNASFAAPSRSSGYRAFNLSDTAVESLNAGEYSEFWWDEYDTIPIGKIKYSKLDDDGRESTLTYNFSADQSIYEMDGNDILRQKKQTQAEAEALFDDTFIPNLAAVAFTPIEITIGNGLPYLEAGDCIEATSYDNVTAKSYLLEQRITGIQHLTQTAESHGGDLMNAKEG